MLDIPFWKRLLILGLVALGLFYAMPNLFYTKVEQHNDAIAKIERTGVETPEDLADRARWPDWLPSGLVNLGLDLRGGAHLLGEVHVQDVYKARMDALWPELRDALMAQRDVVGAVRRVNAPEGELAVEIANPEQMAKAVEIARGLATPVVSLTGAGQSDLDISGAGNRLSVRLSDAEKAATDDRTVQQSLEIIRRRIDEVGTREPTIVRQGKDRILIQVPGIGSAEELKQLIGTTAKLTFNPVVGRTSDANARAGAGNVVLPSMDEPGVYYIIEEAPVVTGEDLTDARPSFDQNGQPAVDFRFGPSGAKRFGAYTSSNIGQPFAIVLDNQVISAPVIRQAITTGSGQISGAMNVEESSRLAVLLRAGALPAEMTFLEERTVGPELGQDSIDAGRLSSIIATAAVVAYMIASYGLFGVFASIAVVTNVILILAVMSMMGATLTLPGIAGIVLTVGTAVDANVIIYERIREELRAGKRVVKAIDDGFNEAMSAIIDANVTTFIAAMVMFFLGSGPVKGFAVTLTIGLVTSVFTAIYLTRLLIVFWLEWRKPKQLIL
ncbi:MULTISPECIES: protein translocase subunit SecD [unclassified Paracoccus (in: a-proteobacteria)]|uniref:protein translocase subunit SecD n=1 Tax=unclassified Paracoccus (in: a-proteobacteria) TaxID=2688777 RepID=UPI0012B34B04|nr:MULTISPECIES: protein translocase subunit SecD [unclassified Paracoccus (in: a-proteobacteria)]UXU74525.1 protein translocase subunit SecD [Paracoccus sp. SMMA_5]UXU80418.1 protein translocase subunit SecD [Paracoccus sp. SMMA_5_TC]